MKCSTLSDHDNKCSIQCCSYIYSSFPLLSHKLNKSTSWFQIKCVEVTIAMGTIISMVQFVFIDTAFISINRFNLIPNTRNQIPFNRKDP